MNSSNRLVTRSALFVAASGLFSLVCVFHLTPSDPIARFDGAHNAAVRTAPTAAPLPPKLTASARFVETYGKLPLSFEANQGQTDNRVKFLSRGSGCTLFLTGDGAVLSWRRASHKSQFKGQNRRLPVVSRPLQGATDLLPDLLPRFRPGAARPEVGTAAGGGPWKMNSILRMHLVAANPAAKVVGLDELPGKINYFIGNDTKKWRTNVPTYGKVQYRGVYPGVDLVYYGEKRQLEYDFVVGPGADPRTITLALHRGSQEGRFLRIDRNGNLVVRLDDSELVFNKPLVYQNVSTLEGSQKTKFDPRIHTPESIEGGYVLKGGNLVGFDIAAYDKSRPLVIDPVLSFSTYLGGSGEDFGNDIALDRSGNVYVTGGTTSADFPTTLGAAQTVYAGEDGGFQSTHGDVFVTKLNHTGSALVYSTYLGGSGDENAYAMAVDSDGNAYLSGGTTSSDFPVTPGAYQTVFGGFEDAFVTKLNPLGSALVFSTYLGTASGGERGFGIAVDSVGSAYVTGDAAPDFPTTPGSFQPLFGGGFNDSYITKLDPSGSTLVYSTFLGGDGVETGFNVAVDGSGNAYVTGRTTSSNFPTTVGAFQKSPAGGTDAYVTVLNPAGSKLVYSTYLGGSGEENLGVFPAIAVDSAGSIYVRGATESTDFPTTPGAFQTSFGAGIQHAFVAKLNPSRLGADSLLYSTLLGGSVAEDFENFPDGVVNQPVRRIAVDRAGNAYVAGTTSSPDFPTAHPIQRTLTGAENAYVSVLNPNGSGLVYSTYLGGSDSDSGRGIAVDGRGNAFVTGITWSSGFPTTPRAFDRVCGTDGACNGASDAFVAKVSPPNAPALTFSPAGLSFGDQAIGATSPPQTVTLRNMGSALLDVRRVSTVPPHEFAQTNTCGQAVGPGDTCMITVRFTPSKRGARKGFVHIIDNATPAEEQIPLTGKGT